MNNPKVYIFTEYIKGGRHEVKVGDFIFSYHIISGLRPSEVHIGLDISHKLGKAYKSKSLVSPTGKEILEALNSLVPTNKELYSAIQNTKIYREICDRAWVFAFTPEFDAIQAKLEAIVGKN